MCNKLDSEYSQYLFMITGYINLFQRSSLVGVKNVKIKDSLRSLDPHFEFKTKTKIKYYYSKPEKKCSDQKI